MSCKVEGSPSAVGYWGRDINTRIEQEQIPGKVEALLQDKLESRGKHIYLWTQVTDSTPNAFECSCVKSTTERPDITCNSCYGTKLIPGYLMFAHETLFMASVSPSISLIDTVIDTDIKPYRIVLDDLKITGSITSSRIQYSNPFSLDWDFRLDAPNIKDTNLVSAAFSTNGIDFYPIEDINGSNKPTGIGGIYLRISLSRASVEDRSPEFQIIRLRHANKLEPYIKILRPNVNEIPTLMQYGGRVENVGERFWTMPLSYFDSNIPPNTPMARIIENAFYQRVSGLQVGIRYVIAKLMYNEELGGTDGHFTHQSFEPRRTQPEEVYQALVF
jgi:hypothetical protein